MVQLEVGVMRAKAAGEKEERANCVGNNPLVKIMSNMFSSDQDLPGPPPPPHPPKYFIIHFIYMESSLDMRLRGLASP